MVLRAPRSTLFPYAALFLSRREPRALQVYDRFAIVEGLRMRYCLAMEYAEHGDLGAWLASKGPQSERFVRREIAAVLGALDALHRGQALHRDLDRKSTRLNSSHANISYAVFCLKKKNTPSVF